MIKVILKKLSEFKKSILIFLKNTKFKAFLPSLYLRLIILGFALTGLKYTFVPKLEVCSSLFGANECDPLGNFIITYASFPGYLFSSLLFFIKPRSTAFYLISGVVAISLLFYYLIGLFIDNLRQKKTKLFSIQTLVIVLFLILFILLLLLI